MEAMWSRKDPFLLNVMVWRCILLTSGVALGFTALGVLYLWPGFNLLNLQPDWYPVHLVATLIFLAVSMPFAVWAAYFLHLLRRGSRM